jgi:hypothetical protein
LGVRRPSLNSGNFREVSMKLLRRGGSASDKLVGLIYGGALDGGRGDGGVGRGYLRGSGWFVGCDMRWKDIRSGGVPWERRDVEDALGEVLSGAGEVLWGADVGGVGIRGELFVIAADPIGLRMPLLKTIAPGDAFLRRDDMCSPSRGGVEERLFRLCFGAFRTPVAPSLIPAGAELGSSTRILRIFGRWE